MKIYIFIIIILISLISFAKQDRDLDLPELGDRVSGAVSYDEEKIIGKEFLKQIYSQAPLINDPLIQEYTELLTYKLSEYSNVKNRKFTVLLIDDASLNAFAAPGGVIGVNGGLFLNADNEGQFSSVMAHELAHLSQRHFARNVLSSKDNSIGSSLTILSSIVLALITNNPNAIAVGPALLQTQSLRYSRLFEKEADRVGFANLVRAGYNPKSMGEMFENMNDLKRLSGETPPEFLLTHPLSSSRINDAMNAAEGIDANNTKSDSLEYSFIRSRLKVLYEKIPAKSLRYFDSKIKQDKSDANIYGLALAHALSNNFNESIRLINILINKYPRNLFLSTSKIEILTKAEEFNKALNIADTMLKISPNNYPLSVSKAKLFLEMKNFQESEKIIRNQLIRRNDDPQLWLLLSQIQRGGRNIIGYHQSRAEYYLLLGQNEEALSQLEFALNLTENNFLASERILTQIMVIKEIINKSKSL
jgi:predicted Zn-dependent protease|tara:strand:- start:22 stop:1449 length:1428 start_codon:yes stop_codon:yes gene_type:complete